MGSSERFRHTHNLFAMTERSSEKSNTGFQTTFLLFCVNERTVDDSSWLCVADENRLSGEGGLNNIVLPLFSLWVV